MADTVLSRPGRFSVSPASPLTATQFQVDGLVTTFVAEASNPTTLAAITTGGLAYRYGRLGIMIGLEGRLAAPVVRTLSIGGGLFGEAATFQLTHRGLTVMQGGDPRLLQFGGSHGLALGTVESVVTFGSLRGAGFLAREQGVVVQHAFQSTAMVGGHQLTGLMGLTPRPEGTLAEQFLHAEVTNIQLSAGQGLLHTMTNGRLSAFEQGLDLSLRTREAGPQGFRLPSLSHLAEGPELALAGAHGRESSGERMADLTLRPMWMKGEGGEGGKRTPPTEGPHEGSVREPVNPHQVMERIRDIIIRSRTTEPATRERLSEENARELERLAEHYRQNPEELKQVLTQIKELTEVGRIEEALGQVVRELRHPKRSPEKNARVARQALERMPLNRETFMEPIHLIPNGLTVAAAICAAVSVIQASRGQHEVAALLLPVAAVLDKLDGAVARALNASHPIGAGLDSYADFAAYGVATAYFAHAVLESHGMSGMANVVAGITFSHALLRLAIFDFLGTNGHVLPTHDILGNPISKERSDFMGMPSTMVGLYAGLIYLAFGRDNPEAFFLATGTAGSAMFWPLRYVKFGNNFKNDSENPWRRIMTLVNVLAPTGAGGAFAAAHGEPRYLAMGILAGAMTYVVSPFFERAALAVSRWRNKSNPTDPSSGGTTLPNPNVRLPLAPPSETGDTLSDRARADHVRVEALSGEGRDSQEGESDRGQRDQHRGFAEPSERDKDK